MKLNQKHILIILFLLNTVIVFGQRRKRNFYFNENNERISKPIFRKYDGTKYYVQTKENDTAIFHTVQNRFVDGQLNQEQRQQINILLKRIVQQPIDTSKTILFHLYEKDDNYLKVDSKYEKYWSYIKANNTTVDAFLIGAKESGIKPHPKLHIFIDEYNYLKTFFFNNSDMDFKHLILNSNGSFKLIYGSYDIYNILTSAL